MRHPKAQRIGGEIALSLPDAVSETVLLDMSPEEERQYRAAACLDGTAPWRDTPGDVGYHWRLIDGKPDRRPSTHASSLSFGSQATNRLLVWQSALLALHRRRGSARR